MLLKSTNNKKQQIMSNKESIHLRSRKLSSGSSSLYLDTYRNGVRQYEYLKLYLIPEKTRADKDINKQTMLLAEAIKAKRTVELHNNEYGFSTKKDKAYFFDFFRSITHNNPCGSKRSVGCESNWVSTLRFLEQYEKRNITFAEITPEWVEGFKRFLDTKARRLSGQKTLLSPNSKFTYFTKLKTAIHEALRRGIISSDPCLGIKNFPKEDVERECLTLEELRILSQTPCEAIGVRRAFLFSCLTGLRLSDVRKLIWGEVQTRGAFTRVVFRQKKTKGQEYLDITSQAVELMGERRGDKDSVFHDLPHSSNTIGECIKRWALRAGIHKNITFHCARHTFAVMMLDIGTDIYTVSKLLGHREIATTQIYARILDKNKQKAVASIPNIF